MQPNVSNRFVNLGCPLQSPYNSFVRHGFQSSVCAFRLIVKDGTVIYAFLPPVRLKGVRLF